MRPEEGVSDQWYFAYGSNLSADQMKRRTGPIGETRRARLDGYRIAFNKRGSDGTGKANIVPDSRRTVLGVVYWCSRAALRDLDKCEGVAGGEYVHRFVRVQVEGGEDLDAVTYVAGAGFIDDSLVPSCEYLRTILSGARDHQLPDEYIREIETAARQRSEDR